MTCLAVDRPLGQSTVSGSPRNQATGAVPEYLVLRGAARLGTGLWASRARRHARQEFVPVGLDRSVQSALDRVIETCSRFVGLLVKGQPRLSNALAALAMIACPAGRDNVVPHVKTAPRARDDVIDRQVGNLAIAILAGVIVTNEDFTPGQLDSWPGAANEVDESNDGRCREPGRRARQRMRFGFEDFGFAADYEHECASNVTHVERLIILVQYEYGVVHPADTFRSGLPRTTFAPGAGCNRASCQRLGY